MSCPFSISMFFRIITFWPEIPTTTDFSECPVFLIFKFFPHNWRKFYSNTKSLLILFTILCIRDVVSSSITPIDGSWDSSFPQSHGTCAMVDQMWNWLEISEKSMNWRASIGLNNNIDHRNGTRLPCVQLEHPYFVLRVDVCLCWESGQKELLTNIFVSFHLLKNMWSKDLHKQQARQNVQV